MKNADSHTGKVVLVSDTHVFVKVERGSACLGCKNKSSCQTGGAKDQVMSIKTTDANSFFADEDVEVLMRNSMGMKAVVYAYLLPFLTLLAAFLGIRQFTSSEIVQVLGAFALVAVYYFILYKMRSRLESNFQFFVRKKSESNNQ